MPSHTPTVPTSLLPPELSCWVLALWVTVVLYRCGSCPDANGTQCIENHGCTGGVCKTTSTMGTFQLKDLVCICFNVM